MTLRYFDPGTEKWWPFARRQLERLEELRIDLRLPAMSKAYAPEPGTTVFVRSSEHGDMVRVTGGGELMFARRETAGDPSAVTFVSGTTGAKMAERDSFDSGQAFSRFLWSKDGKVLAWVDEALDTLSVVRFDGALDDPQVVEDVAVDTLQTMSQHPVLSLSAAPDIHMSSDGSRIVVGGTQSWDEAFVVLEWDADAETYTVTRHNAPHDLIGDQAGSIGTYSSGDSAGGYYYTVATDHSGSPLTSYPIYFPRTLGQRHVDHTGLRYAYWDVFVSWPTAVSQQGSGAHDTSLAYTFTITHAQVLYRLDLVTGEWAEALRREYSGDLQTAVDYYAHSPSVYGTSGTGAIPGPHFTLINGDSALYIGAWGTTPPPGVAAHSTDVAFDLVEPYHDELGAVHYAKSVTLSRNSLRSASSLATDDIGNMSVRRGTRQFSQIDDGGDSTFELDGADATGKVYDSDPVGARCERPLHVSAGGKLLSVDDSPSGVGLMTWNFLALSEFDMALAAGETAFVYYDADAQVVVVDADLAESTARIDSEGLYSPVDSTSVVDVSGLLLTAAGGAITAKQLLPTVDASDAALNDRYLARSLRQAVIN